MSAEQQLEHYISQHPEYWEFEHELKEVARLKAQCKQENDRNHNVTADFKKTPFHWSV